MSGNSAHWLHSTVKVKCYKYRCESRDKMSNQGRHVGSRRLPPLHGLGGKQTSVHSSQLKTGTTVTSPFGKSPGPTLPKNADIKQGHFGDMVITGHNLSGVSSYSSCSSSRNFPSGSSGDRHISSYDLNPDVVSTYLNDNPDFLEKYLLNHVTQDQLEYWVDQKRRHRAPQREYSSGSGDNNKINGHVLHRSQTDEMSKWKFASRGSKRKVLQELTHELHQQHGKTELLTELTACAAACVSADGFCLSLVDSLTQEIHCHRPSTNNDTSHPVVSHKVGPGSTAAAYVADTGEALRISDLTQDDRWPEGIGVPGNTVQSVILQPVLQANEQVVGVMEFYRHTGRQAFTAEDEEIVSSLEVWAGLTLFFSEMHQGMVKQRRLNDFLLAVTKSIFQDIVSMDTVIMKIMNYAQKLVTADRSSLFLVDTNTQEVYARIFDVGCDAANSENYDEPKEIRFPMDKGVAGHVASTGEILNITDAYADQRFNRDVDIQTGYKTKTILCMPIYIRGTVIGVVQMVNKLNGLFTKSDEESFETFAVYCGLALHHAKLYEKIRRSEQKYKVALEVLSYHSQASDQEVATMRQMEIPHKIEDLTKYHFSPWSVMDDQKPLYVIHMFRDLFSASGFTGFDIDNLTRFTLTVRKNYRPVPYHNWAHAFSVAHAVYTVIKTTHNVFTPTECLGLFVACLCHDVDHRGYTNQFMVQSSSPLSAIYSTSTMEHHHFNHTITILQQEGHNIFKHFSSEEYKQVLGDIKHCILATDLALFFGNRAKLKDLHTTKDFSWNSKEHRRLVYSMAMTASDLCVSAKPWDVQIDPVKSIFEEFYAQGDEEKQRGNTPIPMMDREKAHQLPNSQVGFLVGICLPCYELLADILPATKPMVEGARANLKRWQELADQNNQKTAKDKEENK